MQPDKCFSLNDFATLCATNVILLTLFDMGFFEPLVMGGGGGGLSRAPHHNFVVIAPMIMKFGTGVKPDVFYTKVTKSYDVTTIKSL